VGTRLPGPTGGATMTENADGLGHLLDRVAANDAAAVGELFALYRERLRRMILLRMDDRLRGRLDASDVLQEAFLEFARALPEYVKNPAAPFFLWLRCITGRQLQEMHRQHLGTRMRDARREVRLHRDALPEASSVSLAAQLLGKLTTPSQAALRAELRLQVQEALDGMEPTDREVLALRHYEQLTNREVALVLGISEAAASVRFIRALKRLRELLPEAPGLPGRAADPPPGGDP
jgi:RNA polymerase sigma-70 factor (ECF subfamily)